MKALAAIIILALAGSYSAAEASEQSAELIVSVDNVDFTAWAPSGDSAIIPVYLENVFDPVMALDMWIWLNHGEIFRWDTISPVITVGTAMWNWGYSAQIIDEQHMLIHIVAGSVPHPIPPGTHVLMKLMARARADRLDPDGSIADSMCQSPYYEEWGVTEILVGQQSKFSNPDGNLIGWHWNVYCVDSTCIEWEGDSCVAWECIELDSVCMADTNALVFQDGSIMLLCESDCDDLIGDADGSGALDIDDVVHLIGYIFSGGPPPTPHPVASGDSDCGCTVDIDDVVHLIAFIFSGGPAPCSCESWTINCSL